MKNINKRFPFVVRTWKLRELITRTMKKTGMTFSEMNRRALMFYFNAHHSDIVNQVEAESGHKKDTE